MTRMHARGRVPKLILPDCGWSCGAALLYSHCFVLVRFQNLARSRALRLYFPLQGWQHPLAATRGRRSERPLAAADAFAAIRPAAVATAAATAAAVMAAPAVVTAMRVKVMVVAVAVAAAALATESLASCIAAAGTGAAGLWSPAIRNPGHGPSLIRENFVRLR